MANSDITNYLLKRLQGVNNNQSTNGLFKLPSLETNSSIFDNISLESLENFDYEAALTSLSTGDEDAVNSVSNQSLSEIFKGLLGDATIQKYADADGDGEVSAEEAKNLMQGIAGMDGDLSSLSFEDIEHLINSIGVTSVDDFQKFIQDTLKGVDEELAKQTENVLADEVENSMPAMLGNGVDAMSGASHSSGASKSGNSNYNAGGASKNVKTKTAADEVEELRKQRQEIIETADKNINEKQKEKDNLVKNSDKVSDDLKKDYSKQQKEMKRIQSDKADVQSSLDEHKSSLSDVTASLSALEGEKSTIKTDTKDDKINSQNKARLSEIQEAIKTKKEKKAKLEEKIAKEEAKLKELEKKEQAQQKNIDKVEKQIAEADPKLKPKMDALTKEISELKSTKTKEVAEIDGKIKTKEAEKNKEAKKAGESKGKAANDIGSGLVDLASKYMGLNEKDGSYKLFTNGRTESWCADFVTYVVKEFAQKNGMSVAQGFGSPAVANLMSWAQNNGVFDNTSQMSNNEKLNYAKNNLSVGDVIIWKSNGSSHTGLVKSINSDGTFTTVEGNSSDQVKSNNKSIYDKGLTGFIKLSDIVS